MKVASNVTVDAKGILIDGLRLPYHLAVGPIEVTIPEAPYLPEIRFGLLADTISIDPAAVVASPEGDVILLEEIA